MHPFGLLYLKENRSRIIAISFCRMHSVELLAFRLKEITCFLPKAL